MGTRYLIDTNAVIDFCNGKLPVGGKNLLFSVSPELSVITNIELFATDSISPDEYELLNKFVSISKVHPIGAELIQTTIEIRIKYKIKLPDALIAATALVHDLSLITRNIKDFERIPGLTLINPYVC